MVIQHHKPFARAKIYWNASTIQRNSQRGCHYIIFGENNMATTRHSLITIILEMVSHRLPGQCDKTNWCHNGTNQIINRRTHDEWLWSPPGQEYSDTTVKPIVKPFVPISLILVLTSIPTHLLKYIPTCFLTSFESFVTNPWAYLLTVWHTLLPWQFLYYYMCMYIYIHTYTSIFTLSVLFWSLTSSANVVIFGQVSVPIAVATSCQRDTLGHPERWGRK